MIYTYAYPRPAVTVDMIVFKEMNSGLEFLLIERKNEPFKNQWALPGGFVDIDEEVEQAAYRELEEETSIRKISLKQFKTFGKVGRDPRGRTISIVFYGNLTDENQTIQAADDAKNLKWFTIDQLPPLAFDHQEIIGQFIEKKEELLK